MNDQLPLWRVIIFSNLRNPDSGGSNERHSAEGEAIEQHSTDEESVKSFTKDSSVILLRYHQCLADDFSMLQLLLTESQHIPEVRPKGPSHVQESVADDASIIRESKEPPSPEEEPHLDPESLQMETASVQNIELNPLVFNQQPQKHCGLKSTYLGSYWRMVGATKDSVNPLRSKKNVDAPKDRFCEYRILDTTIDDLTVREREAFDLGSQ